MSEFDLIRGGLQPICENCGVTTNPSDDGRADECRECGWRMNYPQVEHPGYGDEIPDINDWR